MKKFFLATLVLFSITSFAQTRPIITHTERGMKVVGGQLQLTYGDFFNSETILRVDDYTSTYGVVVSPNIGWFVEKNWMIGTMLHLGLYSEKSGKEDINKLNEKAFDIGITPMTRYYIDLARRGNIKVFLQAGLPVIYSEFDRKSTYVSGSQTFNYNDSEKSLGLYGTFGFGASLHGRFGAIELNASNMGVNLGFQKFLGKKAGN